MNFVILHLLYLFGSTATDCTSQTAILHNDRVVIPPSLRSAALQTLHSAHQGVTTMANRARSIIFWPGITEDINNTRITLEQDVKIATVVPHHKLRYRLHPQYHRQRPSTKSLPITSTVLALTTWSWEIVYQDGLMYSSHHTVHLKPELMDWFPAFVTSLLDFVYQMRYQVMVVLNLWPTQLKTSFDDGACPIESHLLTMPNLMDGLRLLSNRLNDSFGRTQDIWYTEYRWFLARNDAVAQHA